LPPKLPQPNNAARNGTNSLLIEGPGKRQLAVRHPGGYYPPAMKTKIHPRYQTCTVHCACGNQFQTRSTMAKINVDICSACHPFFTGKQKFVDTAGRVERFSKKFGGTYSVQKAGEPVAAKK
jgi:large subunit ribosomal protein L31